MSKIVSQKRNSRFCELQDYCYLAQEHDFMEVTEWSNGEGFDVSISSKRGEQLFTLTHGEFSLLQVLANYRGDDDTS